jgi:imidazolonepropionase-like amidohydrolase
MMKIFTGATLYDGTKNEPIKDSLLVIEDGLILDVGSHDKKEAYRGGEVIDVRGKTILPGLIDSHIHMDLHGYANTYEENLVEDNLRAIRTAMDMGKTLQRGITTVRNMGSVNHIDFAVKESIEKGWCIGPRILTSGRIISMTARGNEYFKGMYREADGVDEVRKAAREQLKAGADVLKVMATGAYMNPGGVPAAVQLSCEEIKAVVEEAEKLGLRVAAHAHAKQGIINAVLAGVKTIEHGTFMDDEAIELMLKHDVFLVPTYVAGYHMLQNGIEKGVPGFMVEKNEEVRTLRGNNLRKAIKAGVKVAFGTDAGTNFNYHGENAMELILLVNEGFMKPREAICSATRIAAEALGIEDKVGTLGKGMLADFLVVNGTLDKNLDLLLDGVEMVYKEGKRV